MNVMARLHPFAIGHVVAAALVGALAGPFIEAQAAVIVALILTAGAGVSSLVCRWWPGFDAAGWKLWPAAVLANPAMLASLGILVANWRCVVGHASGWDCLPAGVALVSAGFCLLPPFGGLFWCWIQRPTKT